MTDRTRNDILYIGEMIPDGSRVLDVGCGTGELLRRLVCEHRVTGRGLELSQELVNRSVTKGLSVIQGNADTDLVYYADQSFDFAILSQTLQATHNPKLVVEELLRIGKHAIVSFPNFGHWRVRLSLGLSGRMPVTRSLSYQWYETPNIHFCTIKDFSLLCKEMDVEVKKTLVLDVNGRARPSFMANLLGQQAIFLLKKKASA